MGGTNSPPDSGAVAGKMVTQESSILGNASMEKDVERTGGEEVVGMSLSKTSTKESHSENGQPDAKGKNSTTSESSASMDEKPAMPTAPLEWDSEDDPANPYNWSPAKRWYGTVVPGLLCLLV